MAEMTVDEIQKNLIRVLMDAVGARAAIDENPGPLSGDVVRIEMEKRRLDTAVKVATACCVAAGLEENQVQFMIGKGEARSMASVYTKCPKCNRKVLVVENRVTFHSERPWGAERCQYSGTRISKEEHRTK